MSQDAWIGAVRQQVETSGEFRALREAISGWFLDPAVDAETPRPEWMAVAFERLAELGDAGRIAHEAGRRYEAALTEWRYRRG